MTLQIVSVETQAVELQERVIVAIEDNARTAENILNEQAVERDLDENVSAPRFVP